MLKTGIKATLEELLGTKENCEALARAKNKVGSLQVRGTQGTKVYLGGWGKLRVYGGIWVGRDHPEWGQGYPRGLKDTQRGAGSHSCPRS